jgi:hypothetical protein
VDWAVEALRAERSQESFVVLCHGHLHSFDQEAQHLHRPSDTPDAAYQLYNEGHSGHSLGNFPTARTRYRAKFGG